MLRQMSPHAPLDGITDGKVGPYLQNSDIGAFLRRYKPGFLIGCPANDYRHFLRRSILSHVDRLIGDREKARVAIDGIVFINILVRREPIHPALGAQWRRVYRLDYAIERMGKSGGRRSN